MLPCRWVTRWATDDDVEDFEYALVKILRLRFPDLPLEQLEDGTRILETPHQQLSIQRQERQIRLEVRSRNDS